MFFADSFKPRAGILNIDVHARPQSIHRYKKLVVITLFLAWIVPGLIGRDLWKADEPYSFGLVDHIVHTGDWTVPTLAGEPFMEKPPLFYITAAVFVHLGKPWLQPHDAARLANVLFMLLTVVFIWLTACELQGNGYGWIAAIILIGSTGLQITAHKLITDVALLAGFSIAFFGLVLSRRRFVFGGIWLGVGTGMGFMSKGLLAPGIIGMTALALPVFSDWRKKSYLYALSIAFVAALPWLTIWPYALYRRSPVLFTEWFWCQNAGRFFGFAHVGRQFSSASYLVILPWFALPSLPLALLTLWHNRRSWRSLPPAVAFSLIAFAAMFLTLSFSASIRDIYALPMLLPLSLLAAAGVESLRARALPSLHTFRTFNTFTIAFFGLVSLMLWITWVVMITGFPFSMAMKLRALQPGYAPFLSDRLLAVSFIYSLAWIFAVVRFSRSGCHPVLTWTAGIVLLWALLMTIWLPWLDAGSSYRTLFSSLREVIPAQHGIIASEGIGESERALLEYYAGLVTERAEVHSTVDNAEFYLVEGKSKPAGLARGKRWRLLWEQQRPGNNPKETYRLYKRIDETCQEKKLLSSRIMNTSLAAQISVVDADHY